MLLLRFIHDQNRLYVGNKEYKATCPVRNKLNAERKPSQKVKTFPANPLEERKFYDPRKFPTGLHRVKKPIWTDEIDFYPVKIPTDAVRRVLTDDGKAQEDAFYHLHYAQNSRTTLGCIRLDSPEDADEIALTVREAMAKGPVWLEVLASLDCDRG